MNEQTREGEAHDASAQVRRERRPPPGTPFEWVADLPDDYETSLLAPFVDSLSQEIGRALQYFFTSTPHHKVHYVMLAGGTATLPGLKERVTELTGFASMVVNPFEHMKLGSAVRESKLRREAPSYLTACGLAMRRFVQ